MTLRKGHGKEKGSTRIEVLPPDELPKPLPADPAAQTAPLARREDGTIANSEAAKELGRRGGEARANKKRLLQGLGLANLSAEAAFKPYWDSVQAWVEAQLTETTIAAGGYLGPGPASIIGSAGVALAASRFFSDEAARTGNLQLFISAGRLSETSRQHLLAAYELAVREGKARRETAKTYASLEEIVAQVESEGANNTK